jgi:hypothetical protein
MRVLHQLFVLTQCAVCSKAAVAVVASLTGDATALPPRASTPAAIHALDWLDAGMRIDVHAKSTMKLILVNGRSYELSGGAKATIAADGLTATNPQVHELSRLPPIPKFVPIAAGGAEVPGATAIRGPRMKSLYPNQLPAIASQVKLTYAPVPDVANYSVILQDSEETVLLRLSTTATSVDVPADMLKPGTSYAWRVRALGVGGLLGEGRASFVTMSKDALDRRTAFAEAMKSDEEPMRLALLAAVDRQMGLLAEACGELEHALELKPSDPALQQALIAAKAAVLTAENSAK